MSRNCETNRRLKEPSEEELRALINLINGPPRTVSQDDYTGPIIFVESEESMNEAYEQFCGG